MKKHLKRKYVFEGVVVMALKNVDNQTYEKITKLGILSTRGAGMTHSAFEIKLFHRVTSGILERNSV